MAVSGVVGLGGLQGPRSIHRGRAVRRPSGQGTPQPELQVSAIGEPPGLHSGSRQFSTVFRKHSPTFQRSNTPIPLHSDLGLCLSLCFIPNNRIESLRTELQVKNHFPGNFKGSALLTSCSWSSWKGFLRISHHGLCDRCPCSASSRRDFSQVPKNWHIKTPVWICLPFLHHAGCP